MSDTITYVDGDIEGVEIRYLKTYTDKRGWLIEVFRHDDLAEDRWPVLVKAAGFAEMKARASDAAPDTLHHIWKDNGRFFNKGESGQWQGVLSPESLALYAERMQARYDPVVVDWLERGSRAAGDPKTL